MKISFAALTDVGLVRQNNEDNYVICDVGRGTSFSPPPASGEGTADTNGRGILLDALSEDCTLVDERVHVLTRGC